MQLRCRPGDLAFILYDVPESQIGMVVHVIEYGTYLAYASIMDNALWPAGHYWRVELASGGLLATHDGQHYKDAWMPDQWLHPIRPQELLEEEIREQEKTIPPVHI